MRKGGARIIYKLMRVYKYTVPKLQLAFGPSVDVTSAMRAFLLLTVALAVGHCQGKYSCFSCTSQLN